MKTKSIPGEKVFQLAFSLNSGRQRIPSLIPVTCSSIRGCCCFIQACFLFWVAQQNCWTPCIIYGAADQFATDGLCSTNQSKISQPCGWAFWFFLIITPLYFLPSSGSYPGNINLSHQQPCFSKWNTLLPWCNLIPVSFRLSLWVIYSSFWYKEAWIGEFSQSIFFKSVLPVLRLFAKCII